MIQTEKQVSTLFKALIYYSPYCALKKNKLHT